MIDVDAMRDNWLTRGWQTQKTRLSAQFHSLMTEASMLSLRRLVVQVEKGGFLPVKAHKWDAGWDLALPSDEELQPGERRRIDLRVRVAVPRGCMGLILPRSSLNAQGIDCVTGVIDAGYTGTISVILVNRTHGTVLMTRSQRVAQLVITGIGRMRLTAGVVDGVSERGSGGFGSSGKWWGEL